METYKIGNKINGVIRSYTANPIGDVQIQYNNQPYTIFEGASATFTFTEDDENLQFSHRRSAAYYNMAYLQEVNIQDVPLTDKIFNLIFQKSEEKLCTETIHVTTDENGIAYLNISTDAWYQVFVYDDTGALETAFGTLTDTSLQLNKPNADYLIVYSYEGELAYLFRSLDNLYLTIDLEIVGNKDDNTQPMFVHLEKCGFRLTRNLYFDRNANAVDITLKVINDGLSYIVLK